MKMILYEIEFVEIYFWNPNCNLSSFFFKIRVMEQENGVLKSLLTKQSLLGSNESSSSS